MRSCALGAGSESRFAVCPAVRTMSWVSPTAPGRRDHRRVERALLAHERLQQVGRDAGGRGEPHHLVAPGGGIGHLPDPEPQAGGRFPEHLAPLGAQQPVGGAGVPGPLQELGEQEQRLGVLGAPGQQLAVDGVSSSAASRSIPSRSSSRAARKCGSPASGPER